MRFEVVGGSAVGCRTLQEILEGRVGVCQDFAHVLIALARHLGWPARYVSGYLVPEAESEGYSHAWVEIGSSDGSWLGLDPTHKVQTTECHLPIPLGPAYNHVSPLPATSLS